MLDPYVPGGDGIWIPPSTTPHREADYDSAGFASLRRMQTRHFWYRGRHRFILHFARRIAAASRRDGRLPAAIDLGGGCGGWVQYLAANARALFSEIALGDSSPTALALASDVVPAGTNRYQIDLLNLQWSARWDVAFLLDVLEHIDEDERVLREIYTALRPGGTLVVATPALEWFRSTLDDVTHHVRRYSRADFTRLAARTGFDLVTSRYFMFFLSPLLWAARRGAPEAATMTADEAHRFVERSARIPAAPINAALAAVFAAETPLGVWMPFPWGTSVLAVLRRPHERAT